MEISAACPQCHTRYQLKEDLRGKTIICPQPNCRAVFTVAPDTPPPAAPKQPTATRPPRNGSTEIGRVGEIVPILPAEIPLAPEAEPVLPEPVEPEPVEPEPVQPVPSRRSRTGLVGEMVPLLEGNPTVQTDWSQPPPVRKKPTAPRPPKTSDTAQRPAAPATLRLPAPPPAEPPVTPRKTRSEAPAAPVEPPPAVEERRTAAESVPPTAPAEGPRVLAPGDWQAPPPRRAEEPGNRAPTPGTPVETKSNSNRPTTLDRQHAPGDGVGPHPEEQPELSPQAQRGKLYVRLALAGLVLMVVAGGVIFWLLFRVTEARLIEIAMKEYKELQFTSAAEKFKQLREQFAASDRATEYGMLEDLCRLRYRLEDMQVPLADVLQQVNDFLPSLRRDGRAATFKPYHADLGKSLMKRLGELSKQAPPDKPATPELLETVLQVALDVNALPEALTGDDLARVKQEVVKVQLAIERYQRRRDFLARLQPLAARPSGATLRQARRLIREAEDGLPGISQDAAVTALLLQIQEGHRAAVVYHREEMGLKVPAAAEDNIDVLMVDPLVQGTPGEHKDAPLVLAVARGVLYACNRGNGKVRWATRVGVDTQSLPVRLPATPINRERILVISADTRTLTALDEQGQTVWQHHLSKPCLGRPVIHADKRRAFIPTFDGQIHEIELIKGTLLGRFQLGDGERLTAGGTCQDNLLYIPADEGCVYVIDVDAKKCVAILYTNHPSGSLRGEPILVPADPPAPGYLVLTQTAGLSAMQLRVYQLPINDPNADPIALAPRPHVQGWSWFPAANDEEKIALLTDAGVMGLFGIRQVRNQDPALFPQFPAGPEGLNLQSYLGGFPPAAGRQGQKAMGRAQVAAMQGDDFWVLVGGRLQRLQMAWKSDVGPRLIPIWKEPPQLGSPLHDSQVVEDRRTGQTRLFLVTHALNRPACLFTAVDGNDEKEARILWQRQLGLVCQGEVIALQPPDGKGLPLLLAMDPGGALVSFDPTAYQNQGQARWHRGGQPLKDAKAFEENRRFAPVFLRDDMGQAAWQVGCPGMVGSDTPANAGLTLLIRKVKWREGQRALEVERESRVLLQAPPAGPPVRQGDHLLVPLDSGTLFRVPLYEVEPQAARGPSWRARRLGSDTPGHVLVLDDNRFLTSDGLGGLFCWTWLANGTYTHLPEREADRKGVLPPTLLLKSRLTTAPLLVPARGEEKLPRVCVADAAGWVRLLTVLEDGQLKQQRGWNLKNEVTAGPFLRELPSGKLRIGCIVKQTRLVWLDPDSDQPLWEYGDPPPPAAVGVAASAAIDPTEAIIGEPQLVKDVLLVADQAGRFLAIDPTDGTVRKQYRLRGNMSATVSPVPFGPTRAFAPMTDGTVLLLPLK